jgi:hypothetical protein
MAIKQYAKDALRPSRTCSPPIHASARSLSSRPEQTATYNGLQLTTMKRMGHGLQGQVNYTWSHCLDTVSNGGFLQFSAGGILSPLPGELHRDYGSCDYDIRHNLTGQYVYQLPLNARNHPLGYALNAWQLSGTAFWHSGVPFSVLSTPYSANRQGIVQGSGPQFASIVPGVSLYEHRPIPGITQPGTIQWLNPDAFVSAVDPSTGACSGGDTPHNCLSLPKTSSGLHVLLPSPGNNVTF